MEASLFEWLMIGLGLSLGAIFIFLFGWYRDPVNKALFKRIITGRNYAVVGLIYPAGQTRFLTRVLDAPSLTLFDRVYPIDEKKIARSGSVPILFFHTENAQQVNLKAEEITDKFRNPAHLNSLLVILKALFEAKALQRLNKIELYILIIGVLMAGVLLGLYILYNQNIELTKTVVQQGQILNNTIGSALPNILK